MDRSESAHCDGGRKHIFCPGCKASSHTTQRKGELEIDQYVEEKSKVCTKCIDLQYKLLEFKSSHTKRSRKKFRKRKSKKEPYISETLYRLVCRHAKRDRRWKRMSVEAHKLSVEAQRLFLNKEAFRTCDKNPGHPQFIPVHAFQLEDLPIYAQDPEIFQCLKEMIRLTVKLEVTTDNNKLDTVGSGSLYISETQHNFEHCKCCECSKPGTDPVKDFRIIRVTTALHVVINDPASKRTKVYIDFDDDGTGKDASFLNAFSIFNKDKVADRCILECITHDLDLYKRILDSRSIIRQLERILKSRYSSKRINFAVVISHPHGMGKRISFGQITEKFFDVESEALTKWRRTSFSHNVPTCKGSSGAVLWVLGFERVGYMDNDITDHTHSTGVKGNLNYTGEGREQDFPEIPNIIIHNHKMYNDK